MIHYLVGFLVPIAHATELSTSTLDQLVSETKSTAFTSLYGPISVYFGAAIVLAIAFMIFRKFRGMARRPH